MEKEGICGEGREISSLHFRFYVYTQLFAHGLYFPAQTILSPHLGQNFQSLLISNPHFLHTTTEATLGITPTPLTPNYNQQHFSFTQHHRKNKPAQTDTNNLNLTCPINFSSIRK
jgi:hypothetical protein